MLSSKPIQNKCFNLSEESRNKYKSIIIQFLFFCIIYFSTDPDHINFDRYKVKVSHIA